MRDMIVSILILESFSRSCHFVTFHSSECAVKGEVAKLDPCFVIDILKLKNNYLFKGIYQSYFA